jgi:glyoxylase-like metal-dependent hydrolase (beta-lactamase superfamily II)
MGHAPRPVALSSLDFPFPVPAEGAPVEILPGLFWLRLPLPFALDHVNVWLLDDGAGWTVIDTGYGDDRTRAIWAPVLAGRPLTRLLVTHFHPDHAGLVGWLADKTDAPLAMARTEWLTARWLALDASEQLLDSADAHYAAAGLSAELRKRLRARGNAYRRGVGLPPASFTRLAAGDEVTAGGSRWRVIVAEGHAPEQVTLWSAERNLLIAADQLLPRITPVVGVWPMQPEADPLGDFHRSLERYAELPADALVLPSHERPYRGLHTRRAQLAAHHAERLDRVASLCRVPRTTAEVMDGLFPSSLDLHQRGFALAETLAHLNRLLAERRVERWREDSVWRWRAD